MTQYYRLTGRRTATPARSGMPTSLRLRNLFETPEPARTALSTAPAATTTTPAYLGLSRGGDTGQKAPEPDTRTDKEKAVDKLAGHALGYGPKSLLGLAGDVTGHGKPTFGKALVGLTAAKVGAPATLAKGLAGMVNMASRSIPGHRTARTLADETQARNSWTDPELVGQINDYLGAVNQDPVFSDLSPTDQAALQMSGTHVQGLGPATEQEVGAIDAQTALTRSWGDKIAANTIGKVKSKLGSWAGNLRDAFYDDSLPAPSPTLQNLGFMETDLQTGERKGTFNGMNPGIDDPSLGGGMATNPGDSSWSGDLADLDPADFTSIHDANRGNPWGGGGGSGSGGDGPSHAGSGPGGSGGGFAGREGMGL